MVFGDPLYFAISIEYLPFLNKKSEHKKGLFHFMIEGKLLPTAAKIVSLEEEIAYLTDDNPLLNAPENKDLFLMNKVDAFTSIMNNMLPKKLNPDIEIADDFIPDWRYKASTPTQEADSCYAFAVGFNGKVRILAAHLPFFKNYPEDAVGSIILSKKRVQNIVYKAKARCELIETLP